MIMRVLKKLAFVFSLLIVFTVIYSMVYNQPLRFQPKIMAYANSVYSLNPSGQIPDQIISGPAENSARSIRLSWRTSGQINGGEVRFWKSTASPEFFLTAKAKFIVMNSPELRSDRVIHRFAAVIDDLEPAGTYFYKVGDPSTGAWSEINSFVTAPEEPLGFSFVYFGDTQANPAEFGRLLKDVDDRHPDTALYLIAGDLVEDGEWRYMWDAFAHSVSPVFAKKLLAPALGNHDYRDLNGQGLKYFSSYFNTPDNGPTGLAKGRCYSFNYQNFLFIVLDSNNDLAQQSKWLETQLALNSQAKFKIVMFHHPPYHPKGGRDSLEIQHLWTPLFDKYGVDLVLNGHDHSYLRTKKMKNHLPVSRVEDGAIYVVSTSCDKFYDYVSLPEAEIQIDNTLTYQKISIDQNGKNGSRLTFKTFDRQHQLKDEFILEK